MSITVKNGRVFTHQGIIYGAIHAEKGRITWMGMSSNAPDADMVIDAKGMLVLPGLIDAHCHMRDLKRSAFEDFLSGTMSAAAGGITTVFEMPTTLPPTSTPEAFEKKVHVASSKAVVDFGLYAGIGSHNISHIAKLKELGAIAYKTFTMVYPGREKDMEGLYMADDGSFYTVFNKVAKTPLFCSVHAENYDMIRYFEERVLAEGGRDLLAYLRAKPGVVEGEAALRALYFGSLTKARVHIAHISAKEVLEVLTLFRSKGNFTGETCVHYLTFTVDEVAHLGPYGKVSPPLRIKEDQASLWRAINDGTLSMIVSDHAPFSKEMKERGRDNVFLAQAGFTGLQAMVPVMLTHMKAGRITLERLVKVMSENPAKIARIYPKKGVIGVGSDADLTVIDPGREWTIKIDEFYTKDKEGATIYDGFKAIGKPVYTIVRGKVVSEDGVVSASPGYGEFVRPLARRSL
jgi:dihydropyrimidinase/allantoinase